jgi:hypothetical protein
MPKYGNLAQMFTSIAVFGLYALFSNHNNIMLQADQQFVLVRYLSFLGSICSEQFS